MTTDGQNRFLRLQPLHLVSTPKVTALLAVVLVLLVVLRLDFSSPTTALDVSLTGESRCSSDLVIEYGSDRVLTLNEQVLTVDQLGVVLHEVIPQRGPDCRYVFVVADPVLPYGAVVGVLDAAKGAGAHVTTLTPESAPRVIPKVFPCKGGK